jgi:hypothetical protein
MNFNSKINIFSDFNNLGSYSYLLILTFICILSIYYTVKELNYYDSNRYYYIIYITIILSFYILFIALYYFNWNLSNMLYIILMISILFSFVIIIIFYFSDTICNLDNKLQDNNFLKYFTIFLLFIVWILVFFDSINDYTLNTTLKLIIELSLMAVIYHIINLKNLSYIKVFADITTGIIFYHEIMRFYYYKYS